MGSNIDYQERAKKQGEVFIIEKTQEIRFLCRVKTSQNSPADMQEQAYHTEKGLVNRRKRLIRNASNNSGWTPPQILLNESDFTVSHRFYGVEPRLLYLLTTNIHVCIKSPLSGLLRR